MNDEDKKILVEWCGLEHFKWHNDNTYIPTNEKFNPDSDSNQLDMLEDKMIKELRVFDECPFYLDFTYYQDGLIGVAYKNYVRKRFAKGEGKTKNEARLNAIINYVKGVLK